MPIAGIWTACLLLLVLGGCSGRTATVSNVETDSFGLRWQRFEGSHPADSRAIAEALGQPLLAARGVDYHASQLVAVIKAPFGKVRDALVNRPLFQIDSVDDAQLGLEEMFAAIEPNRLEHNVPTNGFRAAELVAAGIPAKRVRVCRITSKPINAGVAGDSSSITRIQIVEMEGMKGASGTILFVQRVDSYESFTSVPPHLVLPRNLRFSGPLVTRAELDVVLRLLNGLGRPPVRMYSSQDNHHNREIIVESMSWLRS